VPVPRLQSTRARRRPPVASSKAYIPFTSGAIVRAVAALNFTSCHPVAMSGEEATGFGAGGGAAAFGGDGGAPASNTATFAPLALNSVKRPLATVNRVALASASRKRAFGAGARRTRHPRLSDLTEGHVATAHRVAAGDPVAPIRPRDPAVLQLDRGFRDWRPAR
jgi:hypothetical protein